MMKKILILTILIVFTCACISGGGGEGQQTRTQQQTRASKKPTATTAKPSGGGIVEKAVDMAAALASGGSYKCTYTYEGGRSETRIKGNRYWSKSTAGGRTGYSVNDGEWVYIWSEGEKNGVKFNIKEMEDMQEDAEEQGYTDIGEVADVAVDVDCRPDVISDSVFKPPTNIQFQDMGETLKQMEEMAEQLQQGGIMADPCSMCDMIPDAQAKEECLQDCGR
jgi:hypothetical protein